jgi:hypothetical protein
VLLLLLLGLSAQGGDPVHYIREHAGGERRSLCTTHASCDPSQFCESVFQTCSWCSRCKFNGDSIDGTCPATRCPATATRGRPDDFAPMLRAAEISPSIVNVVGARDQRVFVKVTLAVTDDVSGLKMAELVWSSVTQSVSIVTYVLGGGDEGESLPALSERAWTTRKFEGSFWFQPSDEAGQWALVRLYFVTYERFKCNNNTGIVCFCHKRYN